MILRIYVHYGIILWDYIMDSYDGVILWDSFLRNHISESDYGLTLRNYIIELISRNYPYEKDQGDPQGVPGAPSDLRGPPGMLLGHPWDAPKTPSGTPLGCPEDAPGTPKDPLGTSTEHKNGTCHHISSARSFRFRSIQILSLQRMCPKPSLDRFMLYILVGHRAEAVETQGFRRGRTYHGETSLPIGPQGQAPLYIYMYIYIYIYIYRY